MSQEKTEEKFRKIYREKGIIIFEKFGSWS